MATLFNRGNFKNSRRNTNELHVAAVCDASTGTTEDAVSSRVLPYLPHYLSSLTHFIIILGTAVIRWVSESGENQNETPTCSKSFKDLLGMLQDLYADEEELTTVKSGIKTVICEACSKDMLYQCIIDRSRSCQTDGDTAWMEHVKQIVENCERFIRSLEPRTIDSQSTFASSSDSEGPEEYTEEYSTLGATAIPPNQPGGTSAAQQHTTTQQTTAVSRDPIPEPRQSPGPDTEDAVGTQGAAAEELRRLVDEDKCKVCLENEMDIVLLPCGHFVTCSDCAARVTRCPTCREVIQATLRAYRP